MASSSPLPPLGGAGSAPLLLPNEHLQLFNFAFEHFSGGKWQRSHHHSSNRRQQQHANTRSPSSSPTAAAAAVAAVSDDTPVMPFSALNSMLLGVGCLVGTQEELRRSVANVIDVLPLSSPQQRSERSSAPAMVEDDASSLMLSYNQTLHLACTLPSVLPPQLYNERYYTLRRHEGGAEVGGGISSSPSAELPNLPQLMEAIRLFVMFQKGDRLPVQALRTVLSTMGEEPLTPAELDYLLHPITSRGGGSAANGLTLLEYLELFKLL